MCDTGYYGYENVKVMAHALVGYVSGELAGSKSSFSNALAAGVNKFVTEEILKDEKTYKHYQEHPEELQWISAALGAAIGQMAGSVGLDISGIYYSVMNVVKGEPEKQNKGGSKK